MINRYNHIHCGFDFRHQRVGNDYYYADQINRKNCSETDDDDDNDDGDDDGDDNDDDVVDDGDYDDDDDDDDDDGISFATK